MQDLRLELEFKILDSIINVAADDFPWPHLALYSIFNIMISRIMGSFPVIGANSAAYLSALGLIVIQVGIGIILKSSQTNGNYAFSVSGSVTISEFFKCLLSASFILRECFTKISNRGRGHALLPSSPTSEDDEELSIGSKEFHDAEEEKISEALTCSSPFDQYQGSSIKQLFMLKMNEVPVENRFGFAKLALLYALINNTVITAGNPVMAHANRLSPDFRCI